MGAGDYVGPDENGNRTPIMVGDPAEFQAAVRGLVSKIRARGAKPVLFMTWARREWPEDFPKLEKAYTSIGRELKVPVAPVGIAWNQVLQRMPMLGMYAGDGAHPESGRLVPRGVRDLRHADGPQSNRRPGDDHGALGERAQRRRRSHPGDHARRAGPNDGQPAPGDCLGDRLRSASVTREEASGLISRYHDALNAHDVDTLASFYADDAVVISPMFSRLSGRPAIRESFDNLFRLAPDYNVQPDPSLFIFEGARAADINTVRATYAEQLLGLTPSGHRIEYQIVRLLTFRGSEIAYERRLYDLAAVIERLEKARTDDELKTAGDIQRALLPRTHHRGAYFEAIGASRPSRAIGGDFFEYIDLPSGAFGLALGDVRERDRRRRSSRR